jgi:hypothetical protein
MQLRPLLFCVLALFFCAGLNATTLFPDEIWEIQFSADTIAHPCPTNCDVLELVPAGPGSPTGVAAINASLFNGATLLGTYTNTLCCVPSFKSSSSLWNFASPTVIDFSSLQNGTFNGRIDFSITSGTLNFDPNDTTFFFLGHAGSSNSLSSDPLSRHVISTAILTPEPATVGLLALGLAGFALRRLRRR